MPMNTPRTLPPVLVGVLSLFLLPLASGFSQTTVATTPVGFLQMQCLANSDTLVALPFTRPAAFTGALSSVSGTGNDVISFSAAPNFTSSQFVYAPTAATPVTDHFYLIIGPTSTALTGTLTVTQNSATVAGANTTFTTQLAAGDRLTINDGYNLLTYTVASVDSATSLTLDRAFVDSAASGSSSGSALASSARTATVVAAVKTTKIATPTKLIPVTKPGKVITVPVVETTTGTLGGLSATFDHSLYEGRWYMITANDASTVTINLNGDTLPSSLASTQVSIIPCWTFNTLFPASNANVSFTPSPDLGTLYTQILIPDYASVGINLAAPLTYYYINNGSNTGWRLVGDPPTKDHGNDTLLPDGYFRVRNASGAPTLPLTFSGAVLVNKLAATLTVDSAQMQDNAVGLARPIGVTLNALGLHPDDNSFQASPSLGELTDELLVYDNTQVAFNKAASTIYYYIDSGSNVGWRLVGDPPTKDHGSDVLPAATALTIRKAAVGITTSASVWSNSPNY